MKRLILARTVTLTLALAALHTLGAGSDPAKSATETDHCRAQVSKFEQAIFVIRQAQGNDAAAKLKEQLLPAKVETDILMTDGYCGLVRYLREKKLIDKPSP